MAELGVVRPNEPGFATLERARRTPRGRDFDIMRADFERLPADARTQMLGMLCQPRAEIPDWWWDVLVGEGDPLYRKLEPLC